MWEIRFPYINFVSIFAICISLQTIARANPDGKAPQGAGSELGVIGLSLKDVVPSRWGIQAESQGAGTPNSIGLSGFVPLWVGTQSLVYLDTLTNVDLPDSGNSSSLTHSPVVGSTVATSTRLGYRWLNGSRSWAFGVTGGYDTRPLATGQPDTGITISNTQTLFFQQVAAGLEAYGATWDLKAYGLLPIGNTTGAINSAYDAGALTTYGLNVGYAITPNLHTSVGYYYQDSELQGSNGSGVLLNADYDLGDSLTIGVTLSYDDIFETRLSANVKYPSPQDPLRRYQRALSTG